MIGIVRSRSVSDYQENTSLHFWMDQPQDGREKGEKGKSSLNNNLFTSCLALLRLNAVPAALPLLCPLPAQETHQNAPKPSGTRAGWQCGRPHAAVPEASGAAWLFHLGRSEIPPEEEGKKMSHSPPLGLKQQRGVCPPDSTLPRLTIVTSPRYFPISIKNESSRTVLLVAGRASWMEQPSWAAAAPFTVKASVEFPLANCVCELVLASGP